VKSGYRLLKKVCGPKEEKGGGPISATQQPTRDIEGGVWGGKERKKYAN